MKQDKKVKQNDHEELNYYLLAIKLDNPNLINLGCVFQKNVNSEFIKDLQSNKHFITIV